MVLRRLGCDQFLFHVSSGPCASYYWEYDHVCFGEDDECQVLEAGKPVDEFALDEQVVLVLAALYQEVLFEIAGADLSGVTHAELHANDEQRVFDY